MTIRQLQLMLVVIFGLTLAVVWVGYVQFMRWGEREAEKARLFREEQARARKEESPD
jgi:hypothetical protein